VAITAVHNIWTLVALATATSEDLGGLDLGAPARPALSPRTGRKAQSRSSRDLCLPELDQVASGWRR
jgi:hypothetical protein